MSSTRWPCSASAAPRLTAVVVLPTPPFCIATAIVRAKSAPSLTEPDLPDWTASDGTLAGSSAPLRPISGFGSCAARSRMHDALAPLLVAAPGSGPPGSPNLSPRFFGRASGRRDADRRSFRSGRLWGRRLGVRLEHLLEPAREALHLSVASVEAVDDLKQDLVLVHQMVHQGLQLLLGLHVELVVVLRAQPVSVGEAVERHQDH